MKQLIDVGWAVNDNHSIENAKNIYWTNIEEKNFDRGQKLLELKNIKAIKGNMK